MGKQTRFDQPVTCGSCGASTEGRMEHRFLYAPKDVLDQTQVMALAAAIKRGDTAAAALELDILFRDEPLITEWIAQGRCQVRP